jgi:uncharacterized MnhB-related membrane protein
MSGDIFFAIFGGLAALTSLLVVLQRNPTHSALFLVMSFLNVACIYVLLGAEFVAVTQIIVYTGPYSSFSSSRSCSCGWKICRRCTAATRAAICRAGAGRCALS